MGNFSQKVDKFIDIFLNQNGYVKVVQGLHNTLLIAICGLIIGIVIGTLIATVRVIPKYKTLPRVLNHICSFYVALFRGTPMVVQLLITYFIIFASSSNGVGVAIFAFGINSGAYVAEIFRGGIMSIDEGQFEAGRSIGFNYFQTMRYIILPQMFKAVLPTLLNEFIALLKETSVAGYVAVTDLTKAGSSISAATYSYYMPLLSVALVYLVIVMLLTKLAGLLERRLRKNER